MRASVVGLALLLGGCYTYVPVAVEAPVAGAKVRAYTTEEGRQALVPVLGPNVTAVEGILIDQRGDRYHLALEGFRVQPNRPFAWDGGPVDVSKAHMGQIEVWRFSLGRTITLGVGVAAGAFLLQRLFGRGGQGGGGFDNGDGDPDPTPT